MAKRVRKQSKKSKIQSKRSKIQRLNRKLPWLKIVIVPVFLIEVIMLVGLSSTMIAQAEKPTETGQSDFMQLTGFDDKTFMVARAEAEKAERAEKKAKEAPKEEYIPKITRKRDFTGKKLVALTFDDGPSGLTTPRLLDILMEKQVKATFFTVGMMMRRSPEVVQRANREGHEIGHHTMWHSDLSKFSEEQIRADEAEMDGVFTEILGYKPKIMRPPYGLTSELSRSVTSLPMINWSVDTADWRDQDSWIVKERILTDTVDGSVILMHDLYMTTVEAMPEVIDTLMANGFEFVTISEMAKLRGWELYTGEIYRDFPPAEV